MRILFTVYGTRLRLYPLVPLAWAFRAAGHEVRIASTPMWGKDLAYTGLPTVAGGSPRVSRAERDALGRAMFSRSSWPTDWVANVATLDQDKLGFLESVGRYMVAAAEAMVDHLVEFASEWSPDAIVHDSFSYAGPAAAAALGVPSVRHLSGTDSAQRLEFTQPGTDPLPEYVALFERFGVDVRTEPLATVDPTPPSMRVVTPGELLSMRYTPYNGPGIIPDGLFEPRQRPRICVTWGHTLPSAYPRAVRPFLDAIEAITALGMECLVAAPPSDVEKLGTLPDSVRPFASIPLNLVLPHCAAIVHQGGDGTALTAAASGIPQLVISVSHESDRCAGRLAAAEAGIYLRSKDLSDDPNSAAVIRDAMDRLLSDPGYADGAGRLRTEIESQPTPAEVAKRLVALVPSARRVPVGG